MDFEAALSAYKDAIVADYRVFCEQINVNDVDAQVARFADGIDFNAGKKYIKVIRKDNQTAVHSFIVKADGGKFRAGDILKAAGWSAPATNKARGNLFTGYRIRWTGAEYLK